MKTVCQQIDFGLHLIVGLRENVINLFNKDKRGLAESRETLLDRYLHNLLRQAERVSYYHRESTSSSLVLILIILTFE